ncbi:MAG: ABC transporter permease [Candidatus Nomurabacteria bacterium]|jgi:putative ABC transport system permease protein|nr:ABC transporter permease [Candidatus Nomurabacteria bacterium]
MKFLDILKSANSNLLRNKGRTFLTILAIFIGSFTIIATSGIRTGVNQYIDSQVASAGGEGYMEIMPKATSDVIMDMMGGSSDEVSEYDPSKSLANLDSLTEEDMDKIREIEGIKSVKLYESAASNAEYFVDASGKKWKIATLSPLTSNQVNIEVLAGRQVNADADESEITLEEKYVRAFGFANNDDAIGKNIKVGVKNAVTGEITDVEATIVGVQAPSFMTTNREWISESFNQEMLTVARAGVPAEMIGHYMATAEFDENYSDEQISELKKRLDEAGFTGMTLDDQIGMMKSFLDAIILVFTIFGVVALIAASIGIINTLFMAVQERTREIGLMKAMGLGRGKIFAMFSLEAITLGFWGAAIGIGLAFIARAIINPLALNTFLKDLPGFNLIQFDIVQIVVLIAIIMLIAFLAGTLPARRAAKKDPIEALRYE